MYDYYEYDMSDARDDVIAGDKLTQLKDAYASLVEWIYEAEHLDTDEIDGYMCKIGGILNDLPPQVSPLSQIKNIAVA